MVVDLELLANALPPLPETADELRTVAKSLGAGEAETSSWEVRRQ